VYSWNDAYPFEIVSQVFYGRLAQNWRRVRFVKVEIVTVNNDPDP